MVDSTEPSELRAVGDELGQELMPAHVEVRPPTREMESNPAVFEPLDGILGERWSEQVSAKSLESLAVPAVDRGCGVQVSRRR